jgi:hypothetical protein
LKPVLVDTSIWIKFFNTGRAEEALMVDFLLENKQVLINDPIRAEILSGASNDREYSRLKNIFEFIPCLTVEPSDWQRAARYRYSLRKKGIQATLIDLLIANHANERKLRLFTADNDFELIAREIDLNFFGR